MDDPKMTQCDECDGAGECCGLCGESPDNGDEDEAGYAWSIIVLLLLLVFLIIKND